MKFYTFLVLLGLQMQPLMADAKKEKLILIHGFMNHRSMNSMNGIFRKNGWDVENYKYKSRDKAIKAHAHDLVVKLNAHSNKDTCINFVAFSLGGLVLKAALNHPDCPDAAKHGRITLISSPTGGSKIARFLGKSKWIRKIFGDGSGKDLYSTKEGGFSHLGEFPETAKVLVISGTFGFNPVFDHKNDGKVSIKESCLKTPHHHEYVNAGHSWICKDTKTINLIEQFLNRKIEYLECRALPRENIKKEKLVLVHGFLNHYSMYSMNSIFRKNGWDVENFTYQSRDKTIEEHAQNLVKRLNTISKKDTPINFVAFSLGGLVLKAALNHPDFPAAARKGKIILVASPINGTKTARFLGQAEWMRTILGKNSGKDLYTTPKNGFSHLGDFPKDSDILVISGTLGINPLFHGRNDGVISTSESCLNIPHTHKYVTADHNWICEDIRTINHIEQFLEEIKRQSLCKKNLSHHSL
jgi:triacylglycerol esterase/lipase EstA (alpha/beta hydrolase family)